MASSSKKRDYAIEYVLTYHVGGFGCWCKQGDKNYLSAIPRDLLLELHAYLMRGPGPAPPSIRAFVDMPHAYICWQCLERYPSFYDSLTWDADAKGEARLADFCIDRRQCQRRQRLHKRREMVFFGNCNTKKLRH